MMIYMEFFVLFLYYYFCCILTLRVINLTSTLVIFRKNVSPRERERERERERVKPCFFVTFNIFISHIFPKNIIEDFLRHY